MSLGKNSIASVIITYTPIRACRVVAGAVDNFLGYLELF